MNVKDKQWLLSFLQMIKMDGDINFLLNEEYTFLKFTRMMRFLKMEGYVQVEGNRTILTTKGEVYYNQLC